MFKFFKRNRLLNQLVAAQIERHLASVKYKTAVQHHERSSNARKRFERATADVLRLEMELEGMK